MEQDKINTTKEKPKRYVALEQLNGNNKLYVCDVKTGVLKRAEIIFEHAKHKVSGVIIKRGYVYPKTSEFYMVATNIGKAKKQFEKQFQEMAEKLKEEKENGDT